MSKKDTFLLRIDPQVLAEIRRWADDELRSINGHIEFLLRQSLRQAGRAPKASQPDSSTGSNKPVDRDN